MNGVEALRPQLDRIQRIALVVGAVALIFCLAGAVLTQGAPRTQFFHSYLMAYLFWIGIALGCSGVVMLHHLTGGGWGFLIRRLLESALATLPVMIVLILPLLFGLHDLYSWARPEVVAHDEILQHKHIYLNIPFFLARMAIYFAIWLGLTYVLNKWSLEQDRTGDASLSRRLQLISGPGIAIYVITMTFASIDWAMSLEPHWFSTIYGFIYVTGQVLTSLGFVILVLALLSNREPLADLVTPERFRDLGNLTLAFVMLWAYVQFSQFLIIWAGNLMDEIPWYLNRTRGGWGWIAVFLIVFHFFVPFFILLSRDIKERARRLAILAVALLFIRWLDYFWLIEPALHPKALHVSWMDVVAPIGIGGLWIAAFVWQLKQRPLLPLHDPRLEELETVHG